MKKRTLFCIALALITAVFILSACDKALINVSFDSDGGSEVKSKNAFFGRVLEPEKPVKEGYTFKGWYLGDQKWNFMTDTFSEDTTLKALWKLNKYEVTYEGLINGVSNPNPSHYTVEYKNRQLVAPTVPFGYTFGGWFDENGNQVSELSCGDITLTAKIEAFPELAPFEFKSLEDSVEITRVKDTTIQSVVIPDYVSAINGTGFMACTQLKAVYINDLEKWCSVDIASIYGNPLNQASELYVDGKLVTDLVIPDGVTEIKNGVFFGCGSIMSVRLPDSLVAIGDCAFRQCIRLQTVTIPDSVTKIGDSVFDGCNKLMSLTIGEGVEEIAPQAFYGTSMLVEVINRSALDIKETDYAMDALEVHRGESKIVSKDGYYFYSSDKGNYLLTSFDLQVELVLPESFNGEGYYIYDNAFKYRTDIAFVVIPDSVLGIGKQAFANCTRLCSVTVGKNVGIIEDGAFSNCGKLMEVVNRSKLNISKKKGENGNIGANAFDIGSSGESQMKRLDGFVFFSHNGVHYLVDYIGAENSIVFPTSYNGSTYVIFHHMLSYTTVRHIVIDGGTNEIPDNAFYHTEKLTTVTLGDSIKRIGNDAFCNCRTLKRIEIGNGVTEIGRNAFWNCRRLIEVALGSSVEKIEIDSFYECHSITSFTVHADNQHFSTNDGALLSKDGTVLYIYPSGKDNVVYRIPDGVKVIKSYAFSWNALIVEVVLNDGVEEICEDAFDHCNGIKKITLGSGVRRIGMGAFYKCEALREILITDTSGWEVRGMIQTIISPSEINDPKDAARLLTVLYANSPWIKKSDN